MLSLLIPTYNYNVYPLVLELNRQFEQCEIDYEIIVLDDGSKTIFTDNKSINSLENCAYFVNEKNVGRASNINKLVETSKFNHVLILEADAFPAKKNYIQLYVNALKGNPQAAFGGVIYTENRPPKNTLLRWVYGHAREYKNLAYRTQHPHDIVFSWNLMVQKKIFLENKFETSIRSYGLEDLVFLKKLKQSDVTILQIDNPCIHQNEELSTIFIEKSRTAMKNLSDLYQKNILSAEDSSLLKAFEVLKKTRLTGLMMLFFKNFENQLLKNLLSEKPVLILLDLYKLGYFCTLTRLKKNCNESFNRQ